MSRQMWRCSWHAQDEVFSALQNEGDLLQLESYQSFLLPLRGLFITLVSFSLHCTAARRNGTEALEWLGDVE